MIAAKENGVYAADTWSQLLAGQRLPNQGVLHRFGEGLENMVLLAAVLHHGIYQHTW